MTIYWGGLGLVVEMVVAYVASPALWIAIPVGIIGLAVGHYIDPLTHWGPNNLSSNQRNEES